MQLEPTVKNIMVVEDDPIQIFIIKRFFQISKENVDLQTFTDGKQAFQHLKNCAAKETKLPGIILLDIIMPEGDGWEFLLDYKKLVSGISKKMKLYIVSASGNPKDIERALNDPYVDGYIEKPITAEKLNIVFEQAMV